jgi:uncharacterized protein (DUF1697 family)
LTWFVAFLRGINVGGHNTVKKKTLYEAFTSLGFDNVSTYKQSGNVVFETSSNDPERISKQIQQKLNELLDINVEVFIRELSRLREIVKSRPFENLDEEGASFLVTFSSSRLPASALPLKIPKSTAEIIMIKDLEAYSITRGHGDGAKPNPFIEAKFKVRATTRNWNIITEIVNAYSERDNQNRNKAPDRKKIE